MMSKITKLLSFSIISLILIGVSPLSLAQPLPAPATSTNTSTSAQTAKPTTVIPQPSSSNVKTKPSAVISPPNDGAQNLATFNVIQVDGNIALTLLPVAQASSNYVNITPQNQKSITSQVRNNTLFIKTVGSISQPVLVTVGINQLSRLIVHGNSSVTANNLTSKNLNILTDSAGNINLSGLLSLTDIIAFGKGQINLIWVNSSQLNCQIGGNARVKLAGKAQFLEARLGGNSSLDANYLRAQYITVQAHGRARAELHPDESLKAFAYDQSNIYYDKKPPYYTEFTSGSGNVLQSNWNK